MTPVDAPGIAALLAVSAQWLALGWLSGVAWPGGAPWGPAWALRLLVGAILTGLAMLLLAVVGISFGEPLVVLGLAAALAVAIRLAFARTRAGGREPSSSTDATASRRLTGGRALARSYTPASSRELTWSGNLAPSEEWASRGEPSRSDEPTSRSERAASHQATPSRVLAWSIERAGRLEQAAWSVFGLVLLLVAVRGLVSPEVGWDAFSHWGLKAKAAFLAGGIVDTNTAHEYYPPLVPLLETWLYLHRGVADIDLGKAVWVPIGCAFAVCLVWHLRLALGQCSARSAWAAPSTSDSLAWAAPLLGLGVLLGTTELAESFATGQGDLALTAFLCLASLAAFQAQRQPSGAWLLQTAIFGLGAGLTKYEGLPRVGVLVLALLAEALLSRRAALVRSAGVLAGAAVAGYLPWVIYRSVHHIEVTSEHVSHLQLEAIFPVLAALAVAFASLRVGGGVLVGLLGLGISLDALVRPPFRLLGLVVVGQLAATLVAFLVTDYSPVLQVQLSATRLVEQWLPLALFVVGVAAVDQALGGRTTR